MTAKELVGRFFDLRDEGWRDVPLQMKFAKGLVSKYNDEQLIIALEMYADKMYSLAFLTEKNMVRVGQKQKDTININYEVGGTLDDVESRNRNKLQRIADERRVGKSYFRDLFEE